MNIYYPLVSYNCFIILPAVKEMDQTIEIVKEQ